MVAIDVPYYLARPNVPTRSGIVLIHEADGISRQLLRFTERLATEGFIVAAVDLYFRTGGPSGRDVYASQHEALTDAAVTADLREVSAALRSLGAEKIGVTGFCMGGKFAWKAARHTDDFEAAVGFYGGRVADELGPVRCPTLMFYGGRDKFIPTEQVEAIRDSHPDTFVYAEAGHGFMRDGSVDYHAEAAADAWTRAVSHFHRYLD